ncbi:MAG: hypothetical protein COA78_18725 [Blastopirellula sp.]|nr:MAG: hypothetical protein COA78_18725 [Blastopirellula sp.]
MDDEIIQLTINEIYEVSVIVEADISYSLKKHGKTIFEIKRPYPDAGFGGGQLIASASGKYVIFSYFSGQSEEAFELFEVTDQLSLIYSSGYHSGETASFGFSEKEDQLLMALPENCIDWWVAWEDEETEIDQDGNTYFDFGKLLLLEIETKSTTEHELRIYPTKNWTPVEEEYDPYLNPEFKNNQLVISMPWGQETLSLPLKDFHSFEVSKSE